MSRSRTLTFFLLLLATTADAKTMYTRPLGACANNGDGTAYTCAASPGAAGAYRGLGSVTWGVGAGSVGNGDTLYVCGLHDGAHVDTTGDPSDMELAPTANATIDGACPSDAGGIVSAYYRVTGGWTGPDAYGVYSKSVGGSSVAHIGQLVAGVPMRLPYRKTAVPDATWQAGSFYHDTVTPMLYVKPLGGVMTTVYTNWTGAILLTNVRATVQNLTIYGLSQNNCIILSNADGSIIRGNTIKWCPGSAIYNSGTSDDVLIENNTITEAGTGILSEGQTDAVTANRWRILSNTITHLNQDDYYYESQSVDNHGIGIQGGSGHLIAHNTITDLGGTCITLYVFADQTMANHLIESNTCARVQDLNTGIGLTRLQWGIEIGGVSVGHVANKASGNRIVGNLISDVTNACVSVKASQPTALPALVVTNNTLVRCGTGLFWLDDNDGDSGFRFQNNAILDATTNIDHYEFGDALTNVIFTHNAYNRDGLTSFEWNGTKSAYAAWLTNSGQAPTSWLTTTDWLADFRLTSTSVLRRAGTIAGAGACLDVRGRPCWTPPDIGAYQSSSGDPAAPRAPRTP